MKTETLRFPNSVADITVNANVIYIHVSGLYDDEVALALVKHLDPLIEQLSEDPIRVWDASGIPGDKFKLSNLCIQKISALAKQIKAKKPGSKAYMLGPSAISFGMARMHGTTSGLEETDVVVLYRLDELPLSIREKLPNHANE